MAAGAAAVVSRGMAAPATLPPSAAGRPAGRNCQRRRFLECRSRRIHDRPLGRQPQQWPCESRAKDGTGGHETLSRLQQYGAVSHHDPGTRSARCRRKAHGGGNLRASRRMRSRSHAIQPEALEMAEFGLNLKPGDEVLTTNQDYPHMLTAYQQRERRDGIKLTQLSFPVPVTSADDLYTSLRERPLRLKRRSFTFATSRTARA